MADTTSQPPPPSPSLLPPSILDTLGEEVFRIVAPVSTCMLLLVLLTAALAPSSSDCPSIFPTIGSSDSGSSDTSWVDHLRGALLSSLAFVYDLAAVLLSIGPPRLLVELAISRDEERPTLVYEDHPVVGRRHHFPFEEVAEGEEGF